MTSENFRSCWWGDEHTHQASADGEQDTTSARAESLFLLTHAGSGHGVTTILAVLGRHSLVWAITHSWCWGCVIGNGLLASQLYNWACLFFFCSLICSSLSLQASSIPVVVCPSVCSLVCSSRSPTQDLFMLATSMLVGLVEFEK
jgi:hypothetical protein